MLSAIPVQHTVGRQTNLLFNLLKSTSFIDTMNKFKLKLKIEIEVKMN